MLDPCVRCDYKDCKQPRTGSYLTIVPMVLAYMVGNWLMYAWFRFVDTSKYEIIAFYVLFGLTFVSWIQCIITHPGTVPPLWNKYVNGLQMRNKSDEFKFCTRSQLWKPPRSHFDSFSQRLVLNMEHFCPWVGNTIGFYNRKFFILFIFYTWCTLGLVVFTSLPRFSAAVERGEPEDYAVVGLLACDALVGLILFFFWVNHMYLVITNSTTVEHIIKMRSAGPFAPRPEEQQRYNIGCYGNMKQVFGQWFILWWVPTAIGPAGPEGDGIVWPTKDGTYIGLLPGQAPPETAC